MKAAILPVSQMALPLTCWRLLEIFADFLSLKDAFIQVTTARGILMEKLVAFLQQLVPGVKARDFQAEEGVAQDAGRMAQEADICKEEVAAVVAKLSRVKVQAARFRARLVDNSHLYHPYINCPARL